MSDRELQKVEEVGEPGPSTDQLPSTSQSTILVEDQGSAQPVEAVNDSDSSSNGGSSDETSSESGETEPEHVDKEYLAFPMADSDDDNFLSADSDIDDDLEFAQTSHRSFIKGIELAPRSTHRSLLTRHLPSLPSVSQSVGLWGASSRTLRPIAATHFPAAAGPSQPPPFETPPFDSKVPRKPPPGKTKQVAPTKVRRSKRIASRKRLESLRNLAADVEDINQALDEKIKSRAKRARSSTSDKPADKKRKRGTSAKPKKNDPEKPNRKGSTRGRGRK